MNMRNYSRIALLFLISISFPASSFADGTTAGSGCAEALVMASYSNISVEHSDWRIATYVTENEWNTAQLQAGANAVIYGVPVGASYSDFQQRVREKTDSYAESLTHDQAINIMWTGLDPSSGNAYSDCLKAKVFSQAGIHLAVDRATKEQVSILVNWIPSQSEKQTAKPLWSWQGGGPFPESIPSGQTIVTLTRPQTAQIITVNYLGHADSLTIVPYPPIPKQATFHYEETPDPPYVSPEQVGWGTGFSAPYPLCTPEKPVGWTIVKILDFHLESTTGDRARCGAWTTCGGEQADTPTRVCRITTVQGYNKGEYEGYGRMTSHLTVLWRHPVKDVMVVEADAIPAAVPSFVPGTIRKSTASPVFWIGKYTLTVGKAFASIDSETCCTIPRS